MVDGLMPSLPAMNFLSARAADGYIELPGGFRIAAPKEFGCDFRIGIRPEHLVFSNDAERMPATVKVIEPTGAETLVLFDVGGHDVTAAVAERHELRSGEQVRLAPKPGAAPVFDTATRRRFG